MAPVLCLPTFSDRSLRIRNVAKQFERKQAPKERSSSPDSTGTGSQFDAVQAAVYDLVAKQQQAERAKAVNVEPVEVEEEVDELNRRKRAAATAGSQPKEEDVWQVVLERRKRTAAIEEVEEIEDSNRRERAAVAADTEPKVAEAAEPSPELAAMYELLTKQQQKEQASKDRVSTQTPSHHIWCFQGGC